jgi:hypothetical protein
MNKHLVIARRVGLGLLALGAAWVASGAPVIFGS